MHRLYATYKDPVIRLIRKIAVQDWLILIPFVLLSLKVRLNYYFFLASPGQSFPTSDDSKWYLAYAQKLIEGKGIGTGMNDLMYLGYNLLLTLLMYLFKDPVKVLFIQALVAGLSVILVYHIARLLFNRLTAIIATYLFCYETWAITLWSTYILADSFFISLLLLCVYLMLKWRETGKRLHMAAFIASAVYLALFKPTGIMALAFMGLYLIINLRKGVLGAFVKKRWLPLAGGAAAIVAIELVLLLAGKLDTLIASMQLNAKMVLYNIYAKGWVFDRASAFDHPFKPNYDIDVLNSLVVSFIVNNWDHVSVLYMKRMVAFLGRWAIQTDLTTIRGIAKFGINMIPTGLFLFGIAAAAWNGLFRKASIIWLLVLAVLSFCIVFFIDSMYRYKAPAVPFIVIGVAYGADSAFRLLWFLAKTTVRKLLSLRERGKSSYAPGGLAEER
ncbi:glycosyltransferase family 39 protein [Paenibacillus ginsengarvi]|uniref:Glycosyltransferase RgtA/B/C/D-like domain-containing protein n=1 Tax=Paenibacillus ginsengarvi TaxID=400777 RepID=A0A3B0C516_9BACL|nr:glycosyltransferase family 39 protein [Paenibacillus ginsengarvi]RKN78947.1 hypothetical protein D7M11_21475 [Paenibacillus ginsengarvi]